MKAESEIAGFANSSSTSKCESYAGRATIHAARRNMRVAGLVVALAWTLGAGSLALFGVFLWSESLVGINLRLTYRWSLVWDMSLCLLFFAQHSILIRRSVRTALKNTIPDHFQGVAYTLASAAVLLTLVLSWQHSTVALYALHGAGRWALRAVLLLTFAGVLWGIRSLKRFDAFGIDAYLAHLRQQQNPPDGLTVEGPYGLVRHPFYACAVVALWATPVLSVDRLLLNVLFTAWILLGVRLEERDLLAEFGESYASYRRAVPMLAPRFWKQRKRVDQAKVVSGGREQAHSS